MQTCLGKNCCNPEVKTPQDVLNCHDIIIGNYPDWNQKCLYQRGVSQNMDDAEIIRRLEFLKEEYLKLPKISDQKDDERKEKTYD